MASVLRLVFSRSPAYAIAAAAISAALAFPLLVVSEYIFLEPYAVAHLPPGTELGFSLILALSALSGLVASVNIYRIRELGGRPRRMGGGMAGSVIGAAAGACSCGPIGFAVISTFGAAGATASAFLTNYEIPIRLAAIGVLCAAYAAAARSLKAECRI